MKDRLFTVVEHREQQLAANPKNKYNDGTNVLINRLFIYWQLLIKIKGRMMGLPFSTASIKKSHTEPLFNQLKLK